MTIETKFNVGHEFWSMLDNRPMQLRIRHIHITVQETGNVIAEYGVYRVSGAWEGNRDDQYPDLLNLTKQDLINSL